MLSGLFPKIVITCLTCILLTQQISAQLYRQPTLNKDGSMIAFCYQGDIWVVSASGGTARRLTVHEANETLPKFSPDDKFIAFSSGRYGNNDLFIMPVEGGAPKRLTFHSSGDALSSWSEDGKLLFTTVREFQQLERDPEVYAIPANGGTEQRILDALGSDPVTSPDGKYIAFTQGGSNPVFREAYTGSANKDIYLFDTETKRFTKLLDWQSNEFLPQWSDARTLYFLSSKNGKYNIYKTQIGEDGTSSGTPVQVTKYTDFAVRFFNISRDGKSIVFEQGTNLYLIKGNSSPTRLNIIAGGDVRLDPEETKLFSKDASEYAVSPNGKLVALVVRGEVFIKEIDKEKTRSKNVSEHPYRDYSPVWLSDTTLIFISDREDDNFEMYLVRSADNSQPNLLKTMKSEVVRLTTTKEDESAPTVSPDGKKIAFIRGGGKLITADISKEGKLGKETILLDGWATPEGVTWSPDSKWLAYSISDLYFNEDVFIQQADNSGTPVNVSMHPRTDSRPFWSPDGSKLGFISARNQLNDDVWFAWLKKEDFEKTKQDWEDKEPSNAKKDEKKDSVKTKPVIIDTERIHERLVQVTSFPGNEGNALTSKDGETFYYTAMSSTAKGYDLYSIKWDGKDLKELSKGGQNPSAVSADKEVAYLYFFKTGGALARHDLKGDKQEALPYALKLKIDYAEERKQMFAEGWRALRDGFYDPNFHGKDWEELKEKYEPLCMAASTEADFREMFNYMLGELNASHMGMFGADRAETQKDATGLLGAELYPVKDGMRVGRVIPDSPADRTVSKLNVGDIITAVGEVSLADTLNFYDLLRNKADEQILLSVKSPDGKEREVVIRPVASLRKLLYEEWVLQKRKLTDEYSGGKLGYLHIQGMDMASFEEFERELTAAGYGKEGLVIDVRYNGGGFTTDLLMTILNYKQHAYTIPRGAAENLEKEKFKFRNYYPTGERLVFAAWLKPSIALCNENSYSNAEIFSHAFKTLGIGKVVGQPTNGSVISTGARSLIDGSYVRMPFRGWFTKATDQNQELGPAVPDYLVVNSIDGKSKNVDEQLKKAVEVLLSQINSK